MMKSLRRITRPRWMPGQLAIYDRFGEPLSPRIPGREFEPRRENPNAVLSRMRWGLGLM